MSSQKSADAHVAADVLTAEEVAKLHAATKDIEHTSRFLTSNGYNGAAMAADAKALRSALDSHEALRLRLDAALREREAMQKRAEAAESDWQEAEAALARVTAERDEARAEKERRKA